MGALVELVDLGQGLPVTGLAAGQVDVPVRSRRRPRRTGPGAGCPTTRAVWVAGIDLLDRRRGGDRAAGAAPGLAAEGEDVLPRATTAG